MKYEREFGFGFIHTYRNEVMRCAKYVMKKHE